MLHKPNSMLGQHVAIPKKLRQWLDCDSPITFMLLEKTGSADMELLHQDWILTDWWSRHVLHINDAQIFQRNIVMRSRQQIYWYARTIISHSCYSQNPLFFDRLQSETIRSLIYNNNRVQRVARTIYPVDNQCLEYYWPQKQNSENVARYWVRLSTYVFDKQSPFYLTELMFPNLEDL